MITPAALLQITSLYGGPLEFLFVVESVDDPAYHGVTLLISEFQVNYQGYCIFHAVRQPRSLP